MSISLDGFILFSSPGYIADDSPNDLTLTQSGFDSPVDDQNSMVARNVTVQRAGRGYGLALRSIRVYLGDTGDYRICHIIEVRADYLKATY